MQAFCTELKGTAEELDGVKFDVIVVRLLSRFPNTSEEQPAQCASAYHHFESIEDVTRTLAFFLKPGGSLMVSDILKPSNEDEVFQHGSHAHIVPHKGGFKEADMRKAFDAAELQDMSFDKVTSGEKHGRNIDFFLAKGVKLL
jgi:hypothetical protein